MFTLSQIRERTRALSNAQVITIFRSVLRYDKAPALDEELNTGEALIIWIADLLHGLQVCDPDQRTLLLQELRVSIMEYGGELEERIAHDREFSAFSIGFADRRYATCSVSNQFFDLEEGVWVTELPHPPLETLSYSVTVLFMHEYQALNETQNATTNTHDNQIETS